MEHCGGALRMNRSLVVVVVELEACQIGPDKYVDSRHPVKRS